MQIFTPIPIQGIKNEKAKKLAMRVNCLGSLYYFIKNCLRRNRLNSSLHLMMCRLVEKEYIKELIEIPRDHFKSTIYSEGLPMWWALPISLADEDLFQKLGYSDEFLRWMHKAHNQDTRTLLVSETITNAIKLGSRIEKHYQNNIMFRYLFPEILPDRNCVWRADTMTHKRSPKAQPHGEGTYEFLGVGGALQSRHYDRIIQDDLVGRDALKSDIVMEDTIKYHQLLVGAFDSDRGREINDELVVGNRWAESDLNSYIKDNESDFTIHTHSASGGCCDEHPAGVPIFPEEYSVEKLKNWENRLGPYLYSCQFENRPVDPKTRIFKDEWLRFFNYRVSSHDVTIEHEVYKGVTIADLDPGRLQTYMVVDPNHAGAEGRCHHAITITGLYYNVEREIQRIYLLDSWAASEAFEDFIEKIYFYAEKWLLREFWLETIAGQRYLKYHIESQNVRSKRFLKVNELKIDRSKNAKQTRIEALVPYFYRGDMYVARGMDQFLHEYQHYTRNYRGPVDVLDTLGYAPQIWDGAPVETDLFDTYNQNKLYLRSRQVGVAGY